MSFSEKFKRFYVRNYKSDHPIFFPLYMAAVAFGGWNAGMAVVDKPDAAPTTATAQQVEAEVAQIKHQLADVMASKEAADASTTEILVLKRQVDRGVDAVTAKAKLDALRLEQAKKNMVLEDKVDAAYSRILLESKMPEARLASVLHDFNQTTHKVAAPGYITQLEHAATWRDECRLDLGMVDTSGLSNNEKTAKIQSCAREANSDDGAGMIAATAGGAIAGVLSMTMLLGAGGTSLRRRWSNQQSDANHKKFMADRARRDAERAANPPSPKPVVKQINNFNLD